MSSAQGKIDLRISCKDETRYRELRCGLRAWRQAYREAWERWRHGEREVTFPAGVSWMRVAYAVTCGLTPPAAMTTATATAA